MWRLWCKALGEKATGDNTESDKVAVIRTLIFVSYFITNVAIVANAIRHWDDRPPELSKSDRVQYNNKVNKQNNVCHH